MEDLDVLRSRMLDGRYRLLEKLGTGGMAVVWRAYDETLRRRVAVKTIAAESVAGQQARDHLRAEARSAAGFAHPSITSVYDYGEELLPDGSVVPYLVMELVEGPTLAAYWAANGGQLRWGDAVEICGKVAAGLAAAHTRGIVHCDVTPNNIILSTEGPKILDFGISILSGGQQLGPDGQLIGTAQYVAPERVAGAVVTAAADVYSLGLLLYRSLSGRLPWPADDQRQILRDHLQTPPAALPVIEGLPSQVEQACMRCLAKDPSERPDGAELANILGSNTPIDANAKAMGDTPPTTVIAHADGTSLLANPGTRLDLGRWTGPAVAAARRTPTRLGIVSGLLAAGIAAVVWLASAGADTTQPQASSPGGCLVTYAARPNQAGQIEATLTIQSSQPRPASQWELTFTIAAGQRVHATPPATVRLQDRRVFLRAAQPIGPDIPALTVTLTATAAAASEFVLDGRSCQTMTGTFAATTETGGKGNGKGKDKRKDKDDD